MQTKAAFGMRFHEVSSFFLKTSPPQPWRWIPRHDCCAIRDRMATHGTGQRMSPHVNRIHVQSKHTTEDGVHHVGGLENHGLVELFMGDGL